MPGPAPDPDSGVKPGVTRRGAVWTHMRSSWTTCPLTLDHKAAIRAVFAWLYGIATMGKPALSVRCRYCFPCLSQRSIERLIRARLGTTQRLPELRPTAFNRRQVGRIRGQVLNPSPTTDNRLGNTDDFTRTQGLPRTPIRGYPSPPRRPASTSDTGPRSRSGADSARRKPETHRPSSPLGSSSTPGDP